LLGRDDVSILQHQHLAQKQLLPVFLVEEVIAFHFAELKLQLYEIAAVAYFQHRKIYHRLNVLVEHPALILFKIGKGQVSLLEIDLILQVKGHHFVKFAETAFFFGSRTKLPMPFFASLEQLIKPFQENNAMNVLLVIEHHLVTIPNKAAMIRTCFDHVLQKVVGLLLYDVFFQSKKGG
jgi:hypothetical protein